MTQADNFESNSRPVAEPQRSITIPPVMSLTMAAEYDSDPHRLAVLYLLRRCLRIPDDLTLYYWRAEYWRRNGRRYLKISKNELRAEIAREVKKEFNQLAAGKNPPERSKRVTSGLVSNVLLAASSIVLVPENEELPLWIGPSQDAKPFFSMANGLVDLAALVKGEGDPLHPHTPKWFTPVSFPYDYQPGAKCPTWLKFFDEVLEGDTERINLLQEWFGYCLTPDTAQCKLMALEGEGANGKSVVCEVLTALLGRDNVSNVPLEIFGERFQLTPTLGKLANIASEIGEIHRVAEGQLKQFTSGDRMYFDRKGIPGIEAYPTARLLFSTNQRPRFVDRSSGLWRRMILVPFRVTIPEERQDKMLIDKLKSELAGIFLWAIDGLRRLRTNGRFTEPVICKEALDEYRIESNPCREFLQDHYEFNLAATTRTQGVYEHYVVWAKARQQVVLDKTQFGKEVIRAFPQVVKRKRGGREARYSEYVGLCPKPHQILEDVPGVNAPFPWIALDKQPCVLGD